ncbi:MAG TPA: DUF58 domain-containing protein, partial [Luteolibacter sp.]
MQPTGRTLGGVGAWALAGLIPSFWPALAIPWWIVGGAMLGGFVIDLLRLRLSPGVEISRRLPGRFALGEPGEVRLTLRNAGKRSLFLDLFDGIPPGADAPTMPWSGEIPAHREIRVFHPVKLVQRGEVEFGRVHARLLSPWKFWLRRTRHGAIETAKVYPNYEPVVRYALLAMQHRENPMGIVHRPKAGSSREFRQLRDYREGDSFAQVDWKATSRRQTLISRDWQEQRNQSIVFLVDTGRRMRAMDGDLPQFDHCLNAILLVSHIALRQGDQIGVLSFGGTNRWLPPLKGAHAMPVLLNHLYDFQTTPQPSDFAEAAAQLMARQRRRSLVIVLTNLRGEDGHELIPALQALQSKHLVLLASLRERSIEEAKTRPVRVFSDALKFAAADRYFAERREVLAELGARGVLTLDIAAQELAIGLA